MGRNLQSELWCRITSDLDEYGDLYEQCQSQRDVDLEKLYDNMCDKFEVTLNRKQMEAFHVLYNMANDVRWCNHWNGIAIGLQLANELRALIDRPVDSYRQANLTCNDISEMYAGKIKELEAYFKECRAAQCTE